MCSILNFPVCVRRRVVKGFVAAVICLAVSAAGAQAQDAPVRTFSADAGIILNPVKAEAVADFEEIMGKVKEALNKSTNPQHKEIAASWKVFKSKEAGPGGSVLYVMVMDPAVQGGEYAVSKILTMAFATEVQVLYKKFSDAYAGGQSLLNLELVSDFGQ